MKTGNSLTSQFSARIGGAPCTSEQAYQESGCDLGIQCSVRCGGLGYRQHRQNEGGELLKPSVHKDHRSRAPGTEGRMMLSSQEMCPCQGRLVRMVAEWVKIWLQVNGVNSDAWRVSSVPAADSPAPPGWCTCESYLPIQTGKCHIGARGLGVWRVTVCWSYIHAIYKMIDKTLGKQHTRNSWRGLNEFSVKMTNYGFAFFCWFHPRHIKISHT